MKRKKLLLFSLILFYTSAINAQLDSDIIGGRDTIFVYDTLVIVDTIRISRPAIDFKNLEELSSKKLSYLEVKNAHSNEKLLIFSDGQTATLLDSDINPVNNNFNSQNSTKMKKLSFLTVMLFAFQNMVLAQNDIGITIGGGLHNQISSFGAKTALAPQGKIGLTYSRHLGKNNRLSFSTGLNYHYLIASDNNIANPGSDFDLETIFFNSSSSSESYHCITLPVILYGHLGRLSIGGGVELFTKNTKPEKGTSININTGEESKYNTVDSSQGLGLLASIQYKFSERLSIHANYARSLSSDYNAQINSLNVKSKMQRIETSVRYRLFKKTTK